MKKYLAALLLATALTSAQAQSIPPNGGGGGGGSGPSGIAGQAIAPSNLNLAGNIAYSGSGIITLGSVTGGSSYTSGTALLSVNTLVGGTGYVQGYYQNVAITDSTTGAATGALANIVVNSAGVVISATIANNGGNAAGYLVNDTLTVSNTLLGGSGSGLTFKAATTGAVYTNVALTGGSGSGATGNFTVLSTGSAISSVSVNANGTAYTTSDTLGVSAANVGGTGSGFSISVTKVGATMSAANSWMLQSGTTSGVLGVSAGAGDLGPYALLNTNDTVDTNNQNFVEFFVLDAPHTGSTGPRISIEGLMNVVSGTGGQSYVGVWGLAQVQANLGGTNTGAGAAGKIFGMNPQATANGQATFLASVVGMEVDVACFQGCSTKNRLGIDITTIGSDSTQGASEDDALVISAVTGASAWHTAIKIDEYSGAAPVDSGGSLIVASGGFTAAVGVDFTGVTFSTADWHSNGLVEAGEFEVTATTNPVNGIFLPAANVVGIAANSSNRMCIAGASGNVSIATAGSCTTLRSVAGAATPLFEIVNNSATQGINAEGIFSYQNATGDAAGLYLVKSKSSTLGTQAAVAAGDSLGLVDFDGSDGTAFQTASRITGGADGTVSSGVVPGNIVLSTANASGVLTEGVRLDSTQILKFSAAGFAANGAVATTVTSLGPTGSHTTIQEWLVVKDSAGTTRWIPAY